MDNVGDAQRRLPIAIQRAMWKVEAVAEGGLAADYPTRCQQQAQRENAREVLAMAIEAHVACNDAALDEARERIEALERQARIADETIANVTAERDRCEERNAVVNDAFATERDRADRIQALLTEESIEVKVLRARLETVDRQYQDLRRENLDLRNKLHSVTLRAAAGLPLEVA